MISKEEESKIFQKAVNELIKPLNDYFKNASILVNEYDKYFCFYHEDQDHIIDRSPQLMWAYRGNGFQKLQGFVWDITFSYTGMLKLSCGEEFRVGFHIHTSSDTLEEIKSYFLNNKLTMNNLEHAKLSSNSYYDFVAPNNPFSRETPTNVLVEIFDKDDLRRH